MPRLPAFLSVTYEVSVACRIPHSAITMCDFPQALIQAPGRRRQSKSLFPASLYLGRSTCGSSISSSGLHLRHCECNLVSVSYSLTLRYMYLSFSFPRPLRLSSSHSYTPLLLYNITKSFWVRSNLTAEYAALVAGNMPALIRTHTRHPWTSRA